jgi:hypothetical protein
MLERLAAFLREAQSATAGQGVSSTKVVWLWAGLASVFSAVLATVGGVSVYVFLQRADGIYWAGVGALWVNALGFAGSVQKAQHQAAKEIALAQPVGAAGPSAPGATSVVPSPACSPDGGNL